MHSLLFIAVAAVAEVVAVAAVAVLCWDLFLRDRLRAKARLAEEFQRDTPGQKRGKLFRDLSEVGQGPSAAKRVLPTRWQRFQQMVEQSELPVTPVQLLWGCGSLGLLVGAITGLVSGWPVLGIAAGFTGIGVPLLVVYYRRQARLSKLLSQLPDALDLMARFLSAGQSVGRAMKTIGAEYDPPIAVEFGYCFEQQNLGLPPEVALQQLAERTGLVEFKILVLAMLVHQQTGGNLTPLLEKLSRIVRERLKLRGHVQAITAEGRLQAILLMALPPLMFCVMYIMNREYAEVLLDYPLVMVGVLLAMAAGAWWIRRIIRTDF